LTGIMIDLSAPDLWDCCSEIMANSPLLKELGFTNSMRGSYESFEDSTLRQRCAEFRGSSLILRDAHFDRSSVQVLLNLRSCDITSLSLERSNLAMLEDEVEVLGTPLLAGLQKMKFLGAPLQSTPLWSARAILNQIELARLFLVGAKLRYFEISYGVKPRLSQGRALLGKEFRITDNLLYIVLRRSLLHPLRSSSWESLRAFVELDHMVGPFSGPKLFFNWQQAPPPPPFKAVDLLVFRCKDIQSIARFNGIDEGLTDVDVRAERLWDPRKDRSVWIYMSTLYTFLSTCKCVYIETTSGGVSISLDWWKFSILRLHNVLDSAEKFPTWQYLIVGNVHDGLFGIQWKENRSTSMQTSPSNCEDWITLKEGACRDILRGYW